MDFFGILLPSWVGWALPGLIAVIMGLAALVVYLIAKAQGTWDQPPTNKKRSNQRRR